MDDRFCYSLSELAEKWNCKENDILHLAANHKLWLSVNLDSYKSDDPEPLPISGWWQLYKAEEIAGFFPEKEEACFTYFKHPKEDTKRRIISKKVGLPVAFSISRNDIVVMADEVERYEIENQVPIIKEQHPKNVIPLPSRLGGKPKSPLTEAVEHSYLKFYKEGNTQVLRAGKVREFLGRLKEFLEEGKPNFDDFVSERIKNIKITKAGCSITTQDKYQEASDSREIIIKSKIYMQGDVSKILSSLRKKYPL